MSFKNSDFDREHARTHARTHTRESAQVNTLVAMKATRRSPPHHSRFCNDGICYTCVSISLIHQVYHYISTQTRVQSPATIARAIALVVNHSCSTAANVNVFAIKRTTLSMFVQHMQDEKKKESSARNTSNDVANGGGRKRRRSSKCSFAWSCRASVVCTGLTRRDVHRVDCLHL